MIIIYNSDSGFTKKYAEMFASATGMKAYGLTDNIPQNEKAVFFGWVFADVIKGLSKAKKKANIKAIVAVGINENSEKNTKRLQQSNITQNSPLFYARGGVDFSKKHGIQKFLLSVVLKSQCKKKAKTKEEAQQIWEETKTKGIDFVDIKNLQPLLQWYQSQN